MVSKTSFTTRQICVSSLAFSILFSLVVILQKDLINQDGILYLEVAEFLQNGQFGDAIKSYRWPFFPLLIAFVDSVTGIGLEPSAYVLNVIFDALLLLAFILIVKELGGDSRVQIAAVVIIFSLAYMNENRADIIRDHGYWACHIFSLWLYLKYYKSPGLWLGVGWSAVALLGALFRIEGFIVWLAMPLVMLLRSGTPLWENMRYLFKSYLFHIFIAIILILYIWLSDSVPLLMSMFGSIKNFLNMLLTGASEDLDGRILALKTQVLDPRYSGKFAVQSFIGVILIILGNKIISAVSWPYVGIFFIRPLRTELHRLDSDHIRIIAWLGIIDLLIVTFFLLSEMFLTSRWVVSFALVFLVFMPFMLVRAFENWRANKDSRQTRVTIVYIIFGLFILYGFLDGLISTSPSKAYVKEAGFWMRQNIDKESKVYSSHARIDYYAGRSRRHSGYQQLQPTQWYKFDYLVLLLKQKNTKWQNTVKDMTGCLENIKQFNGPRDAKITIYRVIHDEGCDAKQEIN